MDPRNSETQLVFGTVVDTGKVYSDQKGWFLVISRRVVKYVFILYSYNANTMFSETPKIRTGKDIL